MLKKGNKLLSEKEIIENSTKLQEKAEKAKNVFIQHVIHIELIEEIDYCTERDAWTDKEQKEISKHTAPLHNAVYGLILNELYKNPKLGLLEYDSSTKDFKAFYRKKEVFEKLEKFMDELVQSKK